MPDHGVDRAIDGLARRQHGAFHHRQAVRLGATRAMRRSRLASGRWVRLLDSDVLALPSHPGTWHRQCMAATLSVPGSGISGRSAAALHGFAGWPRAHIEVVTRIDGTSRSPFATVTRSSTVGRFTVVDGIRVVSPADCLVQLAPGLDVVALGDLVDMAGTTRRHLLAELRDRYVDLAHSRVEGIGGLRAALEQREDGYVPPEGVLGRRLRRLFEAVPALPTVLWEATPPWLQRERGRVDALIPDWKLVVEGDGRAWHTRVADFERDRWRDACALAAGYATLRFSWVKLTTALVACRNVLVAVGTNRLS